MQKPHGKRRCLGALLVALLMVAAVGASGQTHLVRVRHRSGEAPSATVTRLHRMGLHDFDHGRVGRHVEAVLSDAGIERLKAENVDHDVVHTRNHTLSHVEEKMRAMRDGHLNYMSPERMREHHERNRNKTREGAPRDEPSNAPLLPINKSKYHSVSDIERTLRRLTAKCRNIMSMRNIGTSRRGFILWAVKISDNVVHNEAGEPEVLIVGGIHGDEALGREMALWTIEHLCDAYGKIDIVTQLVNSMDLYVVVDANPDGHEAMSRYNSRRVDLNRNFPDQYDGDPLEIEPETQALMNLISTRTFVASIAFHGGATVVSYPWDGNAQHHSGAYSPCPDDRTFRALAATYARRNPSMVESHQFPGGITNGARWYVLYGGMQDWAYLARGTMQITAELSNPKWPHAQILPLYWNANRMSIIEFLARVHVGVWGYVRNPEGQVIPDAMVILFDRSTASHPTRMASVFVDAEHGDYHKILLPGRYTMEVVAPGYDTAAAHTFTVQAGPAQQRDFVLFPKVARAAV